ncbi:3-keto-disaccharide hydrolase [Pseudozobellia thermophila]|uniref:3-keto-alpha-glucoside-1,2-lyase/3-keto-2-hydroxy-glucal hydratase domain-containing protein n=1 Tax=Pseudozobellia thermophila TaxID=192903 RepID=A0A1M6C411_9FLAO|nr:DUF1080 domain-containing protein [Pseudozobellia thermophila]SHI55757.1 protein of unknown function [Pseudozobellia thermophila]
MRNLTLFAFCALLAFACKDKAEKAQNESEAEPMASAETEMKAEEWTVLFDGTSFDGWKEYQKDGVSENWKIEDGAMVFYPPENRKKGEIFDLVTENEYTDFVLSLDWKISEGGNSGVFWGVNEEAGLGKPYHSGPEVQVLDNERHPDAKNGTTHQAGALYDMVAPSEEVVNPAGEWNTMVITINHKEHKGSVELNGKKIVDFPLANEAWNALVAKSKFADWEHFGKFTTGKLGLQDHGNQVAYRNIKIKEL